jgi:hypothetical protein
MKLLFLGCSYTAGCELRDREKYRFSTLVGKKLNAEVVNLARDGNSNHAIARKFLEQDLDQYDMVFVQMTRKSRTEWHDEEGKSLKAKILAKMNIETFDEYWNSKTPDSRAKIEYYEIEKAKFFARAERELKNIKFASEEDKWDRILTSKLRFMATDNLVDGKEWWERYYDEIYSDKYGESDEFLFYWLMKNKLIEKGIRNLFFTIEPKTDLPFDLRVDHPKYPRERFSHPNKIGHIMIARDIMRLL